MLAVSSTPPGNRECLENAHLMGILAYFPLKNAISWAFRSVLVHVIPQNGDNLTFVDVINVLLVN
jgi:hypothetical protein